MITTDAMHAERKHAPATAPVMAARRNLGIAILKPGGHPRIAAQMERERVQPRERGLLTSCGTAALSGSAEATNRNKSVRFLIMRDINVKPLMMGAFSIGRARGEAMITPEQIGERYLAVHHRMLRAVNDQMSQCGLSMARTKVLMRLREQGPIRQSVLAADLGLAPHSITDIVDALERLGLAERRPDATDRRAKLVAITDAGESSLDVARSTRERLLRQIFGALGQEDRTTFLRLLDILDDAARPLTVSPAASVVSA